MVFTVRQSLIN